MSEYRSLQSGNTRPPTWAEKEQAKRFKAAGIEDVYREPADAPVTFWQTVLSATTWHLASSDAAIWVEWERDVRFAFGWGQLIPSGFDGA